jgi:quinol monooxygenase YgiN
MVTRALLLRVGAKPGNEAAVDTLLRGALPLVAAEPATRVWFALRLHGAEWGVFDAFVDDAGRDAHLNGAVPRELGNAQALFSTAPWIQKLDVLASKLPPTADPASALHKALLLTFKAKAGHEAQVEQFLRDAKPFVDDEPGTVAWFAFRGDDGRYGIFDAFADNGARFSHLVGHVPRELAKHALSLLGSMPDMEMIDVLAAKL